VNLSTFGVLTAAMLMVGCTDPALEKRLTAIEEQVAAIQKGGGGPAAVDPAAEKAAGELFKAATEAAEKLDFDTAKAKLKELSTKHGGTRAANASRRMSEELAVVGRPEADLQVEEWFKGGEADIEGGKATLYVFWEVWCPHCKREVPKLSATYDKYKTDGLKVVGLTKMSRDTTKEQVSQFVADNNVSYPIARETGDAMSKHYGVKGVPAAAMVKDGKVVWRGHPARLSEDMITGFLGS